jgi:peptidoglycan/xylan/chitin deacetylase (PgdA/CDA1 family)
MVDELVPATISLTFDCEMAAHYPTWDQVEWNYRKGDLDDATRAYALGAARRVAAAGARMHFFVLGSTFEQSDISWLEEIRDTGHAIGNHTYNHVNVKATELSQVQFRFERSPWLGLGRTPAQLIADDIHLCTLAMRERLGIAPNGFRTPGGFNDGLRGRPDIQNMLLSFGFSWVSSQYARHPVRPETGAPQHGEMEAIVAQQVVQPFIYPTGLVEVPMSPPSDVTTMRTGRWSLEHFRTGVLSSLSWCIEHGKGWDFLSHPSALGVVDPDFEIIDLILDTVGAAGSRARIATLDVVADELRRRS